MNKRGIPGARNVASRASFILVLADILLSSRFLHIYCTSCFRKTKRTYLGLETLVASQASFVPVLVNIVVSAHAAVVTW